MTSEASPDPPASDKTCVLSHPVASHHLCALRDRSTTPDAFRRHARVLATLLAAEATAGLPTRPHSVRTPLTTAEGRILNGRITVVPILRAGLGMVEPMLELLPEAEVRHLGLYRDEDTAEPVHYYNKLPSDQPPDIAFVVDPMLATGGSALAAVQTLRAWGVKDIRLLSLISAPEGIARLNLEDPETAVFTCAIDDCLNEQYFIVPGLGDAGDRIFNT